MYIFIENNNRENGKKRKKEKKKSWVGPDASTPNHYTTEADYVTLGKSLQFHAFSIKLPPARWSSHINRAINGKKTM